MDIKDVNKLDYEYIIENMGLDLLPTRNDPPIEEQEESRATTLAREFMLKHNLTVMAGEDLLKMLSNLGHNVPNKRASLFNCKVFTSKDIKQIQSRSKKKLLGNYIHIGLHEIAQAAFNEFNLLVLEGYLFVDGASLTESSTKNLWVILFKDIEDRFEPILIGCYAGFQKFKNFDDFIEDTVCDFEKNDETGIQVKDDIYFKFSIKALVMDSQAKVEALHTCGTTGYTACNRCPQVGTFEEGAKSMQFSAVVWQPLRTDESFRARTDPLHHTEASRTKTIALERLKIDLVRDVVIDVMHNSDCGVVKRMMVCLMNTQKNRMTKNFKLSEQSRENLDARFEHAKACYPIEFQRKSRSLFYIDKFKCSEFRCIALYANFYLLNGIVHDEVLNNFLEYSIAMRLLADDELVNDESNIDIARVLNEDHVANFEKFYGKRLSYVIHMSLHQHEDARRHGSCYKYSAYPFEAEIGRLKSLIKSPNGTELVQLVNRYMERGLLRLKQKKITSNKSQQDNHLELKTKDFHYRCNHDNDSYALIKLTDNNKAVPVKLLRFNDGVCTYRCFDNISNPYTIKTSTGLFVQLKDIGIFYAWNLREKPETTSINNIFRKCFAFPMEQNKLLLVSMLHGIYPIDNEEGGINCSHSEE